MNNEFKFLSKEEESKLIRKEKEVYRAEKKKYEERLEKEKQDFLKAEKMLTDFRLNKEEYLSLFNELNLSPKHWKIILLRNYSAIYSFRKRFGVLGKEECNSFSSYLDDEGGKYLKFFEAAFDFFPYEEYEEILQKMLVESLKFPMKKVRDFSISYLKSQISKGSIGIFFWRDLLEKRYISGSTWQMLIEYKKTAVEQGIDKDIYAAILSYLDNPDKYHKDVVQTQEKWKSLNINPLETYKP